MDFNTLSGSNDFIEERDFRVKLLKEKKLFPYLCSKVQKNGRPIHERTARKAFEVESYDELVLNKLALWLESEDILKRVLTEQCNYAK